MLGPFSDFLLCHELENNNYCYVMHIDRCTFYYLGINQIACFSKVQQMASFQSVDVIVVGH